MLSTLHSRQNRRPRSSSIEPQKNLTSVLRAPDAKFITELYIGIPIIVVNRSNFKKPFEYIKGHSNTTARGINGTDMHT